jgi:hypothetical protein
MPQLTMRSFRYRTGTLLGPWRDTANGAVRDPVRARQASLDEDGPGWHWIVPGAIEEREDVSHFASRNDNTYFPPPERRSA